MPHDSTQTTSIAPPPLAPIAHWLHALALLLILFLAASLGVHRAAAAPDTTPHLVRYSSSMLLEWLLLGSVLAGIYIRRTFLLRALQQPGRSIVYSLALGVAVYCVGFAAMAATASAVYFTPLFHKRNEAIVLALLPHTPVEFVAWFFLSLTAGVCEEFIFRGYLLQQFTAWTNRPVLAIVAAGALFGCVHLYEGLAAILPLAALGIVYGFIVHRFKGDLRPVIIAHTLQDFLFAFLALARPFIERHQPHA